MKSDNFKVPIFFKKP